MLIIYRITNLSLSSLGEQCGQPLGASVTITTTPVVMTAVTTMLIPMPAIMMMIMRLIKMGPPPPE